MKTPVISRKLKNVNIYCKYMIDEITFFNLWHVFENDKLYGNNFTIKSLIDYLSAQHNISFEFYYEHSLFYSSAYTTNSPSKHDLMMSELLTDAYKHDLDNEVKTYVASDKKRYCESLIYCMTQCGLAYKRYDKEFIFDVYRHDLYDLVKVEGAHKISKPDFFLFFNSNRLPPPYILDNESQYNSLSVYNYFCNDKCGWTRHIEAKDIIMSHDKLISDFNNVLNNTPIRDEVIFNKCGDRYEIIFNGVKTIERGIGFEILYYIIKNSPKIISVNQLHADVYKENIVDINNIEHYYDEGANLNFNNETTKSFFNKKKEKINIALRRAIEKIGKHNPELALHFQHCLSRKNGYKYSPPPPQ